MSEPAKTNDPTPPKEAQREQKSRSAEARPSDGDGPNAGPSLDLPMSSPD